LAASDNIDHNLGSNTAHSSFHDTAIPLILLSTVQSHGIAELEKSYGFIFEPVKK
jgi:hypothetical protein